MASISDSGLGLVDVSVNAALRDAPDGVGIHQPGHGQQAHLGKFVRELLDQIQAIQLGQADVNQGDVGLLGPAKFQAGLAIGGAPHQLHIAKPDNPSRQDAGHHQFVLNNGNPDFIFVHA